VDGHRIGQMHHTERLCKVNSPKCNKDVHSYFACKLSVECHLLGLTISLDANVKRRYTLSTTGYDSKVEMYKGKFRPITDHEGPEGKYRYSSTIFLT
jgi:hypothetical protein